MYDLLYLNYLYICFCKKIEKVLLSNLRPYVFDKLFYNEKQKKELLTDIIQRKDENILRPYWNFWLKAIKSQHLINEASRKLLQIRSNKENKLSNGGKDGKDKMLEKEDWDSERNLKDIVYKKES